MTDESSMELLWPISPQVESRLLEQIGIYCIALIAIFALVLLIVRKSLWRKRWLSIVGCTLLGLILPTVAEQAWPAAAEQEPTVWFSSIEYNQIVFWHWWILVGSSIAGGIVGCCIGFVASHPRDSRSCTFTPVRS